MRADVGEIMGGDFFVVKRECGGGTGAKSYNFRGMTLRISRIGLQGGGRTTGYVSFYGYANDLRSEDVLPMEGRASLVVSVPVHVTSSFVKVE